MANITGLSSTAQAINSDSLSPEYTAKVSAVLNSITNLEYPLGLRSAVGNSPSPSIDAGPYIRFTALEYKRGVQGNTPADQGRKKFSVHLPMPGNLVQAYGANWSQFSGKTTLNAASTINPDNEASRIGAAIAGTAATTAVSGVLGKLLGNFPQLDKITDALLNGDEVRNAVSAIAGYTINPRDEFSFNGMQLRHHQFDFDLIPRSSKESDAAIAIIQSLKAAAHPGFKDSNRIILEYPYEFIIEFFGANGQAIDGLPNIPDCFMTNISVIYNPGLKTAKLHNNVNPADGSTHESSVSYHISMQFSESIALTRPDILALDNKLSTNVSGDGTGVGTGSAALSSLLGKAESGLSSLANTIGSLF